MGFLRQFDRIVKKFSSKNKINWSDKIEVQRSRHIVNLSSHAWPNSARIFQSLFFFQFFNHKIIFFYFQKKSDPKIYPHFLTVPHVCMPIYEIYLHWIVEQFGKISRTIANTLHQRQMCIKNVATKNRHLNHQKSGRNNSLTLVTWIRRLWPARWNVRAAFDILQKPITILNRYHSPDVVA